MTPVKGSFDSQRGLNSQVKSHYSKWIAFWFPNFKEGKLFGYCLFLFFPFLFFFFLFETGPYQDRARTGLELIMSLTSTEVILPQSQLLGFILEHIPPEDCALCKLILYQCTSP